MKQEAKEKLVRLIKASGQSIIDNADRIANDYEYIPSKGGLSIHIDFNEDEPLEIEVIQKFMDKNTLGIYK